MLQSLRPFLAVMLIPMVLACNSNSSTFQQDADIIRLKHLEYYGSLLKEYHSKTGKYPLVGKSIVPIYVFIASPKQVDDIQGGPPYAHKVVDFKDWVADVEAVLGRPINEYYDPQYEPDLKPNFYIYMIEGNTYNFAVHTSESFPFSNPVGRGYNKIEITNNTNGAAHLVNFENLISNSVFINSSKRKISKPEFFKNREMEFINSTKN